MSTRGLRSLASLVTVVYRADRRRTVTIFALSALSAATLPLVGLWLKWLLEGALAHDRLQALLSALALAATLVTRKFLAGIGWSQMMTLQERTAGYLDETMVEAVAALPGLRQFEDPVYADKLELLRRERALMGWAMFSLVGALEIAVSAVVTLTLLVAVNALLIAVIPFGLVSLLAVLRAERYRQAALDATAETSRRSLYLFDLATREASAKELRLYRLGPLLRRRHEALAGRVDATMTRAEIRGALVTSAGWLVFVAGYFGGVAFAAYLATTGAATVGDVVLAMTLLGQLNTQVAGTVYTARSTAGLLGVVDRYRWLLSLADERPGPTGERRLPSLKQGIELRDVTFSYPGASVPALEDVTLSLPAGSTVAFVGENGAGKTTIAKLLCRLYDPSSGEILADRVSLRELDVTGWRGQLSGAFQDFVRFELRAADVVGVGDLAHLGDARRVEKALERAGAGRLFDSLPSGGETRVGRSWGDGVDLSGGQWQQLAVARGMFRGQPLLLVLDEPTASLDAETERRLFDRYVAAAKEARRRGSITVIISHRFSTVRAADKIVVLERGRVVEQGSHAELIRMGGLYAELYRLQSKGYASTPSAAMANGADA